MFLRGVPKPRWLFVVRSLLKSRYKKAPPAVRLEPAMHRLQLIQAPLISDVIGE